MTRIPDNVKLKLVGREIFVTHQWFIKKNIFFCQKMMTTTDGFFPNLEKFVKIPMSGLFYHEIFIEYKCCKYRAFSIKKKISYELWSCYLLFLELCFFFDTNHLAGYGMTEF